MVPYPCPAVSQTAEVEAGLLIFFEFLYICIPSIFILYNDTDRIYPDNKKDLNHLKAVVVSSVTNLISPKPFLPSLEKLNSLMCEWLSKRSIKLPLIESINFFIFFFFTSFCKSSSKTISRNPFTMSQHCDLILAKLRFMLLSPWVILESLILQKEFVIAFVLIVVLSSLRLLTVQLFFL